MPMPRNATFVDYVCRHISRFDLRETNLQVVLPTIRLGRVLGRQLARLARQEDKLPCWLPQFVTIDKLVASFSGLGKGEPLELLALLYLSYAGTCRKENVEPRPPDRFWEWGKMLLSDFNQIDNQLAPAQDILQYMAEEKRIGSWHLDLGSSQGKLQSGYLAFYNLLWPLYQDFRQRLIHENIAYTGLAGRIACERLPRLLQENAIPRQTFYLFAGFNALTGAEKQLIKTLVREKKAEIIWNADRYYLDDDMQEAGHFLRQYKQDPDLNHFFGDQDVADKIRHTRIEVVECAQHSAQAHWAVQRLCQTKETEDTALVLNDERLFAPVMNALPGNIACNATIAAPLSGTFSGELFLQLTEIRKFLWQSRSRQITARQFLKLLRNPLLALFEAGNALKEKETGILDSHRSYYALEEITSCFPAGDPFVGEIMAFIAPGKDEKPAQAIRHLQGMARFLLDFKPESGTQTDLFSSPLDEFEQAYLLHVEKNCRTCAALLEKYGMLPVGESLTRNLFSDLLSVAGLSYTGRQEGSLNIMGMLETRGMNFKHAILLSMNEGTLPAMSPRESFLLNSVRMHYGLPTQTEEAAMQAHHFYSLLQDCPKVTLVYVNSPSDRNAEPSRFILQLRHELPAQVTDLPAPAFDLVRPSFRTNGLVIGKTGMVLDALKHRLTGRGLSYSSLHTYFLCPLRFYLSHVMNLGEPPQVQDRFDKGIKGSVFHKVMENFFLGNYPEGKSLLNKPLDVKDTDILREKASTLIDLAIAEEFKDGELDHGANYLARDETRIFVERYAKALEEETRRQEVRVLHCELPLNLTFSDLVPGMEIRLDGFADRLDLVNDEKGAYLRIIDYKTGNTEARGLDPEEWGQLKEKEYKQALQLSFYIFLYRNKFPQERRPLQACICGLKKRGEMLALGETLRQGHDEEERYLAQMKRFLRESVEEILNPDIPIRCTENSDHCEYCPFIQSCRSHAG